MALNKIKNLFNIILFTIFFMISADSYNATNLQLLLGDHICNHTEVYYKTKHSTDIRTKRIICSYITCPTETYKEYITSIISNSRVILQCCAGYKIKGKDNTCVPICKLTCVNGNCNNLDICECNPGYEGEFCQKTCPKNKYGLNCRNSCNCTKNERCDIDHGCICNDGFIRDNCEMKCLTGTFGKNCANVCQECPFYQVCDHINGSCVCKKGCRGPLCIIQYVDGVDCQNHCQCKNEGICDTATGKCTCKSGYMGEKCSEECPFNFYGQNCTQPCMCFNSIECNAITGKCICIPGWYGDNCTEDVLPTNKYNTNSSQLCKCEKENSELCNSINGKCICLPGWSGEYCNETCSMQTYGRNCQSKCNCQNNSTCSPFTGKCNCLDGWTGVECNNKCLLGNFGYKCEKKCLCDFRGTERCDPVNGTCYCKENWTGNICDQKIFIIKLEDMGDQDTNEKNNLYDIIKFIAIIVVSCISLLSIVLCGYKMFVKIFEVNFRNPELNSGAARCVSANATELTPYTGNYGPTQVSNLYEEILEESRPNPDAFYDRLDFQRPTTNSLSNYTIIRSQK